jgi:ABC-type uncharacterized transport system ATPase subunit
MQVSPSTGFTTGEVIALTGVTAIGIGWLVSAIAGLLKHDRNIVTKQDDEHIRQITALWKAQDDIKRMLDAARTDIAVIDDRLQNTIPDMHHYDSKLETLRTRLESKLDEVLDKLHTTQIQLARITPED